MVFSKLVAEWKESRNCNYLLNVTTCRISNGNERRNHIYLDTYREMMPKSDEL